MWSQDQVISVVTQSPMQAANCKGAAVRVPTEAANVQRGDGCSAGKGGGLRHTVPWGARAKASLPNRWGPWLYSGKFLSNFRGKTWANLSSLQFNNCWHDTLPLRWDNWVGREGPYASETTAQPGWGNAPHLTFGRIAKCVFGITFYFCAFLLPLPGPPSPVSGS